MKLKLLLFLLIFAGSPLFLFGGLRGRHYKNSSFEREVRLGFFADPHFQTETGGIQTDLGGPSYRIPENTKRTLNSLDPDYIFGMGDLTAHSEEGEWTAYKKWINELEAPVYDILGNHDRQHIQQTGDYGTGYFDKLKRLSGTKVLRLGNNIFILVSEEHDPAGDGNSLSSTIPDQRFGFIEEQLKKYSGSNNVFILSHTPLPNTTAFSDPWCYGDNGNWIEDSQVFMELLREYEVDAHFSAHIHTSFRLRDEPHDLDWNYGVENVGKFVSGTKISNANRSYPPYSLPKTYFLNMPVVAYTHGWFASHVPFVYPLNSVTFSISTFWHRVESLGPSVDLAYHLGLGRIFDESEVCYFNLKKGKRHFDIEVRWTLPNRDIGSYKVNLSQEIRLGDGKIHFLASDLSLRRKENLTITGDHWFEVEGRGEGIFSKRYRNGTSFEEVVVDVNNLQNYSVLWKGRSKGGGWSKWRDNAREIGKVNSVKLKISFNSQPEKTAYIDDITLKAK